MENKTEKGCGRIIIRFDIPNQVCGINGWVCHKCKKINKTPCPYNQNENNNKL